MQKIVLLVDDEPQLLNVLTVLFKKQSYEVYTAENGESALKILAQTPVHLIISDYQMPNMTGVELLSKVKNLYPKIIGIIISGYADFNIIQESMNAGIVHQFIEKPWDSKGLLQLIEEAFNLNANQHQSVTDVEFMKLLGKQK